MGAIAASAGPPIGGLLVALDWRWIFLINIPVGIATLITGALLLPRCVSPRMALCRSAASALALLLAMSLLVLATVEKPGGARRRSTPSHLFAVAALAAAATVERTLRAKAPVIHAAVPRASHPPPPPSPCSCSAQASPSSCAQHHPVRAGGLTLQPTVTHLPLHQPQLPSASSPPSPSTPLPCQPHF